MGTQQNTAPQEGAAVRSDFGSSRSEMPDRLKPFVERVAFDSLAAFRVLVELSKAPLARERCVAVTREVVQDLWARCDRVLKELELVEKDQFD